VKTRLSESEAEAGLNQSQCSNPGLKACDWLVLSFLLPTLTIVVCTGS